MALVALVDGTRVSAPTTEPAVVIPSITPTAPPPYVPPTNPYIAPDPMESPPPPNQFRGEGGTPFSPGSAPPAYIAPPQLFIVPRIPLDLYGYADDMPVTVNKKPIDPWTLITDRPGDSQIMPVPVARPVTKPTVAPAIDPVQKPTPGPISGTVAGFDLSRIPFWAWLAAAALLGSRLLR